MSHACHKCFCMDGESCHCPPELTPESKITVDKDKELNDLRAIVIGVQQAIKNSGGDYSYEQTDLVRAVERILADSKHNADTAQSNLTALVEQAQRDNEQPKTADGVVIRDGTVTWCDGTRPFPHTWRLRDKVGQTFEIHCAMQREKHYSTRELALAKGKA